jgi:hypothetical protein
MTESFDGRQLRDIINETLDRENISVKKLSETTNVPESYLKFLLDGQPQRLPPSPYVRGYLTKIAQFLDLDRDSLWELYKSESNEYRSGALDRLPDNRFALKTKGKKIIVAVILGIAVLVYLIWNLSQYLGAPILEISLPATETTTSSEETTVIEGRTDYSNKLTINNEQIYLDQDGHFKKEYPLQEGLNYFEIVAKKFLGGETKIIRKVVYQKLTPIEEQIKDVDQKNTDELKNKK